MRRLLYEIVYNLCDNAIQEYNADGGSVDVRVGAEGGSACLTVRDTGIGIPPEHQSRIFERFYRVDKSHSKASGGTGLGLSIVKHAVAYHHGTIALKSEVGKGTEIAVRFPAGKITAAKRESGPTLFPVFVPFIPVMRHKDHGMKLSLFHEIGAADAGKALYRLSRCDRIKPSKTTRVGYSTQ